MQAQGAMPPRQHLHQGPKPNQPYDQGQVSTFSCVIS
jgi:hypothetical protein